MTSPRLKPPTRNSQPTPVPQPEPQPYQYGQIGRPPSQLSLGSTRSPPSSPAHPGPHGSPPPAARPPHSRTQSLSVLTTSPHSSNNHGTSPGSAAASTSGRWTPPHGASTALTPGLSIPSSSRPPTPGTMASFAQLQPNARQSWPRIGGGAGSDDSHDHEECATPLGGRPQSERRPSRLSLTLANWNPETDGGSDE